MHFLALTAGNSYNRFLIARAIKSINPQPLKYFINLFGSDSPPFTAGFFIRGLTVFLSIPIVAAAITLRDRSISGVPKSILLYHKE